MPSGAFLVSPSMRGRGLKRRDPQGQPAEDRSPSMRGRGLKLAVNTGVDLTADVALHAGAWIETCNHALSSLNCWSPSMRGRGLKLVRARQDLCHILVALHAGAWIETGPYG